MAKFEAHGIKGWEFMMVWIVYKIKQICMKKLLESLLPTNIP